MNNLSKGYAFFIILSTTFDYNSGSSTSFDNLSDENFKFIDSVDSVSVGDTFTLEIVFDSPVEYDCSSFDETDIFGKDVFFQPYLNVLHGGEYNVPSYDDNSDDFRRLAVPASWNIPDESTRIWTVYENVSGNDTDGPDFSNENGTWILSSP